MKKIKTTICYYLIVLVVYSIFLNNIMAQNTSSISNQLLNDGRKLSYSEFGNALGTPVFYFHGFPGSHLDVNLFNGDQIAKELNIRLIAVNRPGYGDSDNQKIRMLLYWPKDISELADSLKIEKFSILGYSGGGPFAFACVYKIPERINKVVIVSGMTPFDAPFAKEGTAMLIPKLPGFLQNMILKGMKKMLVKNPQKIEENMRKSFPDVDNKILEDPTVKCNFINTIDESLKNGHWGSKQDAKIYKKEWGFELSDIKNKIYMFHGEKDLNVKIEAAKYMADQLVKSESKFYENEGHLSLIFNHTNKIFELFVGK